MRSLAVLVLAAAAAAPQAQTLEQRAAEVVRAMGVPPPVETVIQSGINAIARPAAASAPAVQIQPVPTPPQLVERLNPTLTPQQSPGLDPRGTAFVNDPRGTALMGVPPGMSDSRASALMPGLVMIPVNGGGTAVSGTSNLTTGPRSFAAGDGGNP